MQNRTSAGNANTQSGNVILFILLAIVLFAALAYTFMRGSEQGTGNMTQQQAKIAANEILDYARVLENTINQLRSRGCSESQISLDYDNPAITGYENPNAPTDFSCHLFHTNGGKLVYRPPLASWLDQSRHSSTDFGKLIITGKSCVFGIGTNKGQCAANSTADDQDLVLIIPYVRREICDQINSMMNSADSDGSPSQDSGNSWALGAYHFTGTFIDVSQIGSSGSPLANKPYACYEGQTDPPAGTFHIYNVLIAR
jgi:hypothetical protein